MTEFDRGDDVIQPSGLGRTTVPLKEGHPSQQTLLGEPALRARPIPETTVARRPLANILPTKGMPPIAIAIPLVAAAYLVVAFWVTFLGSELSLILGVVTLIVMMLLGLIKACGAFARNVEPLQSQGALMIRSFTVVALMCMTSGETATAFDLKETIKGLMPCKYAAIRLCERPQQLNAAALWKCGATLAAAPQEEIGKRCVAVLKRYGAALN